MIFKLKYGKFPLKPIPVRIGSGGLKYAQNYPGSAIGARLPTVDS